MTEDKTGLKFGKLTVLSKKKKVNKRWYYECECECGTVKYIQSSKLNENGQKSCGCLNYIRANLIGEKFGRLTVIAFSYSNKKARCQHWSCQCDCGKEIIY